MKKRIVIGLFILAFLIGFSNQVFAAKPKDNAASVDFAPYMRNMQKSIKAQWNPPKGDESKSVVLIYKLNKKGELVNSSVLKSSGDKDMDYAALNALVKAAPFGNLPKDFNGKTIDVQFTFDYNVYGSGGNNK